MLAVSFKNLPSLTLFELIAAANFISWLWPEPGGDSHMKWTGMLVGNFEFNP